MLATELLFVYIYCLVLTVLATSLFGDVAPALREHGLATLVEHCCYFRRSDRTY